MSGFTTTGASVLTDIEALDRSLLIWRQFTQWLGGMGIVVLALAVLPRLRVGGRQLIDSEMPGPGDGRPRRPDPRHGAQALDALHRPHARPDRRAAGRRAVGSPAELSPFEALGTAFSTMPTGAFATARSLEPFAPDPVDRRGVHGDRGDELRAPLPDARPPRPGVPCAVTRRRGSTAAPGCSARWSSSASSSMPTRPPARGDSGTRSSATSLMTGTGFAIPTPRLAGARRHGDDPADVVGGSAGSPAAPSSRPPPPVGRVLRRELRQTMHPELVTPIRLNGPAVRSDAPRDPRLRLALHRGSSSSETALFCAIDAPRLERRSRHHRRGRGVGRDARQRRPRARVRGTPWGATSRSATSRSS